MADNLFIIRSFGLFFRHHPGRLILLFLVTLFLGLSQGITIILMIPLLELMDPAKAQTDGERWTGVLHSVFDKAGIGVTLTMILVIFTMCLFLIAFLNYFQSIWQANYQQGFSYETRKRIFKKIITSDWAFLNRKSKHNHIQVLTTEIPKMTTYYYFYLGLATKLIFIAAHVFLALLLSVKFTLVVLLIGLVLLLFLGKYLKRAALLGSGNIQAFRQMLKHIDDFWLTVKMAKVHQTEEFYFKKFDESNTLMLDHQYKQLKNRVVPQLLFALAGVVSLVVVVYLAFSVAKLPLPTLFVMILLFARIFPQLSGINNDSNMLVSNVESVRMVLEMDREIEERPFKVPDVEESIAFHNQLEISNLYFGYDQAMPLFTNFSQAIPARKMTGIIGKSGCGKTTLIDLIAGLQKAEQGTISVDGVVLTPDLLPGWRSGLGYLPQDPFFIDGTIRENLIWDSGKELSDEQIYQVLEQVNGAQLVSAQQHGLDTILANYQYHFSGGERQRLALARVLIRKPKLLLLDEATSALDPANEAQIMDCLVRLKREITIVFVSHRQNLRPYFDKIIDLDKHEGV